MRNLVLSVLLASFTVSSAVADEAFEARRLVAAEYISLANKTMDFTAMAQAVMPPLMASLKKANPDIQADQEKLAQTMIVEHLSKMLADSMQGLDTSMAEAFSLTELEALRDFYASAEGQSVMSKMPAFMSQNMPRILQSSLGSTEQLRTDLARHGIKLR